MKEQILKLKNEGKSYEQIAALIPCAVSTVWYHCTKGAKANRISRTQENRQKFKIEIKLQLGGKCSKCGYDKCLDALDFHHTNHADKEHEMGDLLHTFSKAKALEEVKKCVLLCANCHREYHADDGYSHLKKRLAPTLGNAPS